LRVESIISNPKLMSKNSQVRKSCL
jgi:hypothetical protein